MSHPYHMRVDLTPHTAWKRILRVQHVTRNNKSSWWLSRLCKSIWRTQLNHWLARKLNLLIIKIIGKWTSAMQEHVEYSSLTIQVTKSKLHLTCNFLGTVMCWCPTDIEEMGDETSNTPSLLIPASKSLKSAIHSV